MQLTRPRQIYKYKVWLIMQIIAASHVSVSLSGQNYCVFWFTDDTLKLKIDINDVIRYACALLRFFRIFAFIWQTNMQQCDLQFLRHFVAKTICAKTCLYNSETNSIQKWKLLTSIQYGVVFITDLINWNKLWSFQFDFDVWLPLGCWTCIHFIFSFLR